MTPQKVLQKQQRILQRQEGRVHNCKGNLCLYDKEPLKQETNICGEYIIEITIHNKMRLEKCDVYTGVQGDKFTCGNGKRSSKDREG